MRVTSAEDTPLSPGTVNLPEPRLRHTKSSASPIGADALLSDRVLLGDTGVRGTGLATGAHQEGLIMRRHRTALVGLALALLAATGTASASGLTKDPTGIANRDSAAPDPWPGKWADWGVVKPVENIPRHPESQAYFRYENVKVVNGDLVISTMRHCLKAKPTEKTKPQTKACSSKAETKYSTGRVEKNLVPAGAADWKVTFKAKVPQGAAGGTRSALWMLNNPGVGYCVGSEKPTFGEIDVLEWYTAGKRDKKTTATTHLECNNNEHVSAGAAKPFVGSRAKFHDWSVERQGQKLTYRMDNKVVLKQTCNKGDLSGVESCDEILNAGWIGIIQSEVFKRNPGAGFYAGPDWKSDFPTITFVIRDVTVVSPGQETTTL